MAPSQARRYLRAMADVVFNTDLGDTNALYIWPSEFVIAWGTWGGFDADRSRGQFSDAFSEADWSEAIERATAAADQGGFPTVIVVRDAQGT
jgi:hypothetical protein